MRTTQLIGHTDKVFNFLAKECEKLDCIDVIEGMFMEPIYGLHKYKDKDGNIWEEFEQDCPWSSGPMIFLGIKNGDVIKGWTLKDRSIGEYVDYEKGEYWV